MGLVVLKKLLSRLFFPVPLCLELLLLGLLVLAFARRRSRRGLGVFLVIASGLLLAMFASPPFADSLLRRLEARVVPLTEVTLAEYVAGAPEAGASMGASSNGVARVVVLGQWTHPDGERVPTHRIGSEFLARLTEGVRVFRMLEAQDVPALLVVTMANEEIPVAERRQVLDGALALYGVPSNACEMVVGCYDTRDELTQLAARSDNGLVLLVSTASHLPRALLLAEQVGVSVLAAPAGAWTGRSVEYEWHSYIPCAWGLQVSERAIYEYIGLTVARVSGLRR
jgi:uncharacterized SAM-binding protein YcdF (DUF218 family)